MKYSVPVYLINQIVRVRTIVDLINFIASASIIFLITYSDVALKSYVLFGSFIASPPMNIVKEANLALIFLIKFLVV